MIENLKKRADNIYYHGPQDIMDILLIAAFIFICIVYVLLFISCFIWAIAILFGAIAHHSFLYLLWWIPCIAAMSVLIAIGCFVMSAMDN